MGHYLKTCSSREMHTLKTAQNFLLTYYDIIAETIIGRVKEAKFYSIICCCYLYYLLRGICASHRLNLVIGTSRIILSVRSLMDLIKDISCLFNFSPTWAEHLQNFIKKYEQGKTNFQLIDVCRTRWISRIDGLDVSEELFTYFVETLEYFSVNPESTINIDTSIKAQALLTYISNFNFIVSLDITRKVFGFTHSVSALLQDKWNDIINGFELIGSLIDIMSNIRINIDKNHDECFSEVCKLPQKINVNESVPRTCARQTATENFPAESPSHYYKLSLSEWLKRRFEGN